MSMYGRYVLLKKEIERNQIKTVYFEISYNALTLDKKTLGFEGDIYELGRFDNIIERVNFFKNAFLSSFLITDNRRQHLQSRPLWQFHDPINHLINGLAGNHAAIIRTDWRSYTGPQQSQKVIDFGYRPNR